LTTEEDKAKVTQGKSRFISGRRPTACGGGTSAWRLRNIDTWDSLRTT